MAAPVEKHGGEVLKFVGDGMLAIFPLENRRRPATRRCRPPSRRAAACAS